MPLLKRKAFEKSSGSEFLRDDEEVFHCEITDEIFSDYEEYCERIILVNSMVWSCEMTGKPNLTYTEALESEKNARKSLRDFPMELRVPILYLASRTKRCTFAEMLDDVFNFVRDRYFVGESVEACLEGDTWLEGQILLVTAPKQMPTDANGSPSKPSSLYCYEVEQFDDELDGNALGRVAIVPHDRVRRSRGVFTRDKNKLYLKQFVEQGPGGVIRIKNNTMEKYNIMKVKFDQIFTGAPPEFASSKKFDKVTMNSLNKGKPLPNGQRKQSLHNKPRQESIAKYMTKVDKFEGTKQSKSMELSKDKLNKMDHKSGKIQKPKNGLVESKSLKDEMKRVGEELKQKKLEEKIKKKEKSVKLAAYLKEWNKQKDDLELEDHNALPQSIPVEIPGLPNKYFGDFMAILEFFQEFSKPLKLRDAFHNGVDMEILRRAIITKEVAGPLSDIIQVLLGAIFSLQEDEAEEYNEDRDIQDINDIQENPEDIGMTAMRGIQLATAASKWPQTYMATPLSQLPIDSQTFSEVLRLHLLSSGSGGGDRCMKWRYQQRGGYSSQDDPGLWLRIRKPHVIKALSRKHLTQLPLSYKFAIITCLINQIISYATIRDLIEEKLEKSKNLKYDIRNFQVAERKREAEVILTRQKIRRDAAAKKEEEKLTGEAAKALDEQIQSELETLHKESETKKAEYEKKLKNMQSESFTYQSYLGSDRAHRRYWVYETISGLFIEHDERFNGICMDKPVTPNPSLATAPPEDALSYVQRLFENEHGGYSDKENDSENGLSKKLSDPGKSSKKAIPENNLKMMQDLLMCTANPNTCPVHSNIFPKTRWSFLYSAEHFDSLVGALNKRGIRENDLRHRLDQEKELIVRYITKCPVSQLNPTHSPPTIKPEMQTRLTRKYVDANLRFPPGTDTSEVLEMSLRDAVVDLEEKLFMGCLGELQIKDRHAWRDIIINRGYDKQCNNLTWGPQRTLTDDLHIINGKTKVDAEANAAAYKEPGYFLGATGTAEVNDSDNESEACENSTTRDDLPVVKDLASALLQLGQAVSQKYLKRPLGYDEKERLKETKTPLEFDALRRWETSLMECTSFAQVMLHLVILDNSILWSKSILNANCRICRRRTDAENMLLCDLCNKGHHMYCLKPKLTKVPEGDWFCDQCKPKEKTPQKRNRKVFKEEDSGNELDDSNSWDGSVSVALCTSCGSGGVLVQCTVCSDGWHSECLPKPPQRRVAFICPSCNKPKHKNRELDRGVRRCAADAMTNINHYAKMLKNTPRQQSDSESSEEPFVVKTKRKRPSKESSPVAQINGSSKKPRRSAPVIHSESGDEPLAALKPHKKRASKESSQLANGLTNGGTHGKRSIELSKETANSRRSSAPSARLLVGFSRKPRRSEAINQPALEELVNEVMKHKDSWPFNAPVTVEEVPDYFNIITQPMDFETIKMKLERKKYLNDAQVMADSSLVFNNCFTYNHEEDAVAKAGVRLQKFFDKRCKELNLPGISGEEFSIKESSKKKNRTLN